MIKKIIIYLQNICFAAKISIIFSVIMAIVLMIAAFFVSGDDKLGMEAVYISEMIAESAVKIFGIGIFLGLSGDFLMAAVDRRGK